MEGKAIQITKDKTAIIKGIAILFMIAHHCFIKEFYVQQPDVLKSTFAIHFYIGMKMCVGLYTFFVGYGFYFAQEVNATYIAKHVWRLLKQYWIVLAVSILFAYVWGGYGIDLQHVITNLFGIQHQYNLANWYVYFYIYALCVLPLLSRALQKKYVLKAIILTVICAMLTYLNERSNIWLQAAAECTFYTPVLIVGYLCAKTQILTKYSSMIKCRYLWVLVASLLVPLRCVTGGQFGVASDIVFAPLFVISIAAVFTGLEQSRAARVLTSLGSASTMMWFIHAIPLSTATRELFQTISFWINNPIAQFLILTVSSYFFALLYNMTVKLLTK